MPTKTKAKTTASSISDEAVKAKTGKGWREWFSLLDKAGAKRLDHQGIVAILDKQHGVGPWWRQMVTVEYERARGLREKHETADGYVANVSKTFAVGLEAMFAVWERTRTRNLWLQERGISLRSATPAKVLRFDWSDGQGKVEVRFTAKGAAKTQVAVQHSRLSSAAAVAEAKSQWRAALARLEARFDT